MLQQMVDVDQIRFSNLSQVIGVNQDMLLDSKMEVAGHIDNVIQNMAPSQSFSFSVYQAFSQAALQPAVSKAHRACNYIHLLHVQSFILCLTICCLQHGIVIKRCSRI
jgi:hypothetical protein